MTRKFLTGELFHNLPGTMIVIEGPDGCGKDTQIKMLKNELGKRYTGRRIVVTHEPWDVPESPDGMRIRRILKHQETVIDPGDDGIKPAKFQKLYVSDRYTHWVLLVLRELEAGSIVICSRERMSTYAYGYAFGLDVEEIRSWHALIPLPDVFIYLDTPADVCAQRILARAFKNRDETGLEYFETAKKLEKIIPAYRHIRDLGVLPVVAIDGGGYPRQIHEHVIIEAIRAIERR